jgi:DNA-directed RNA polymerase subunit RPC12/RpoP
MRKFECATCQSKASTDSNEVHELNCPVCGRKMNEKFELPIVRIPGESQLPLGAVHDLQQF